MIQPADLQKNDTIGLVAPGRKLDAATIHASINVIESWGFQVQAGKNILSTAHSYLAGSDTERFEDFQTMLDNPDIKAIICARGGYGTTRILDQLNFSSFLKSPKWICGFSDVTALHLRLQKLDIQSIHGTMPVLFLKSDSTESVSSLRKALSGERIALEAHSNSKNKLGSAKGNLIGGNLSLIVDSLGTSSEVETENKVLVIEEVDEYLYKIDRMLVQLKRANKLQKLAGLAIGHMTDLKDTELPFGETIEGIILNHIKEFDYPVAFGFPIGHANPNLSWVEGSLGTLSVMPEKSSITFS